MAVTDTTGWRVKVIIFLAVILISVYTISWIFCSGSFVSLGANGYPSGMYNSSEPDMNIVSKIFGTITFAWLPNVYMLLIVDSFMALIWVVLIWIGYTLFKDWSPW